jgi:hypothetical protein
MTPAALQPLRAAPEEAKLSRFFDGAGGPVALAEVNGSRRSIANRRTYGDSVVRAREAWGSYRGNHEAADDHWKPSVSRPKTFFISVYGIGQMLGTDTTIGPRISVDMALSSARRTIKRFFAAAPGAIDAFERFFDRMQKLDAKSPNRMRKRIQEALFKASLLPADTVAIYLDSLIREEERAEIERFRAVRQLEIVASFKREVEALLRREESAHPGPDRYNVAAVLVTGSMIYGAGLPDSDLDFFILTRDGTSRHVKRFMEGLEKLRAAHGWPDWPDKRKHPYALPVDGAFAPRLASEFQSVVVSLDPEIAARYNAIPLSAPFYRTTAWQRLRHRALLPFYKAFLRWTLR